MRRSGGCAMDTNALAIIVLAAVVEKLVDRTWDGLEALRNKRRRFRHLLDRAEELHKMQGEDSLRKEAKALSEACQLAPRRRKRELTKRTRDIYLKLGDLRTADKLARQLQQTGGIFGLLHRKVCTRSTVSPAGPASASRRTSGGMAGTAPPLPAPVEIPISELPPED